MRRPAAWTIVALGVFFMLDAALFTWWRGWTSGAAQLAGGIGCIYTGIALLRLESGPTTRRDRSPGPGTRV